MCHYGDLTRVKVGRNPPWSSLAALTGGKRSRGAAAHRYVNTRNSKTNASGKRKSHGSRVLEGAAPRAASRRGARRRTGRRPALFASGRDSGPGCRQQSRADAKPVAVGEESVAGGRQHLRLGEG